jgi:creatinine amidohydrolase
MTPNAHVLYTELTPKEFLIRIQEAPIAYLPLGTLEWHGEHLPLGSDGLQAQGFFIELAKEVGGIVLPMLFVGPDSRKVSRGMEYYGMDNHGFHKDDPRKLNGSAYWVEGKLFKQILDAIFKQLARAGFRIVVAHGHGPSTEMYKRNISEWSAKYGFLMFHCWREPFSDENDFGIQTDHAAANETSLMMALYPELVHMENLSKNLDEEPMAIIGRDPRIYASATMGSQAIKLQLNRMKIILQNTLVDINKEME